MVESKEQDTIETPGARAHVVKDKFLHVGDVMYQRLNAPTPALPSTPPSIKPMANDLPAFVLRNVLSPDECERLTMGIEEEEELQYEFWNPEEPDKVDLRNVRTVEIQDEQLAAVLWERMKDLVVKEVVVQGDEDKWESGMQGTWRACGINPVLLFANYGPGNHFSPHTDGNNVVDFNHRSLFSVLVYLNTCAEGGGTLLFNEKHDFIADNQGRLRFPEEAMADKALARIGDVFVFSQELLHEGEPVGDDSRKIIIRTDVMYERVDPLCDSEEGREAFSLYQQATLLEGQKKFAEAALLYRKSVRMCEELARHLNIYGAF